MERFLSFRNWGLPIYQILAQDRCSTEIFPIKLDRRSKFQTVWVRNKFHFNWGFFVFPVYNFSRITCEFFSWIHIHKLIYWNRLVKNVLEGMYVIQYTWTRVLIESATASDQLHEDEMIFLHYRFKSYTGWVSSNCIGRWWKKYD